MPRTDTNTETFDLYEGHDPRGIPTYGITETARYLKIPLATLRSWVHGRYYPTEAGKKFFSPVITLPDTHQPLLSFYNLVEAHVLDAIRRNHNIPLFKVRDALSYLENMSHSKHPLADHWFQTNGVDLFIEEYGKLVSVSQQGQLAMRELIQAYLQRIERDPGGSAARLYPFIRKDRPEGPRLVVIDPFISFGKPVLAGTGIPTAVIAERYQAGESMDELAKDYGLKRSQIEEAVRYEFTSRAA